MLIAPLKYSCFNLFFGSAYKVKCPEKVGEVCHGCFL